MVLKILVNAHKFLNNIVVRDGICSKKQTDLHASLRKTLSAEDKKRPDRKWTCQFFTEKILCIMDHYSACYEEKLKICFLIKQKSY